MNSQTLIPHYTTRKTTQTLQKVIFTDFCLANISNADRQL